MGARKFVILSCVLAVLAGVALFTLGPGQRHGQSERSDLFPSFDASAVDGIAIAGPDGAFRISRSGEEGWILGEEDWPADAGAVTRALEDLGRLRREAVASTNPEKRALFGVTEEEGTTVRFEGSDRGSLVEFVVGRSGPDLFSGYLLLPGSDEVLLVSSNLGRVYGRPPDQWRNRSIVDLAAGEITALTVTAGGESYTLLRDDGGEWKAGGRIVDGQVVEDYLGKAVSLRASAFAGGEEEVAAGFEEPAAVILFDAPGGGLSITVGALKEEDGQRYLRTDRSDIIYLVSRYTADALLKSEEDFPSPPEDGGSVIRE